MTITVSNIKSVIYTEYAKTDADILETMVLCMNKNILRTYKCFISMDCLNIALPINFMGILIEVDNSLSDNEIKFKVK